MHQEILISTIITTFGGGQQLERALDSVLEQSYRNIEAIVVDDNEPSSLARKQTENSMLKYVNEDRVKYIKHEKNKNGAAARNTGIRVARGEYIAFLDDDDYYLPQRFEAILDKLSADPNFIGIYTGVEVRDKNGYITSQLRPIAELQVKDLLLDEMALGTGSNIFVRSNVVRKINGFDEDFVRRQDIEFMIRVCECGKVGHIRNCYVIKSVNGVSNLPKYEKMKQVIEMFSHKFKSEIDSLGDEKSEYYNVQATSLFGLALNDNNAKEIREALNRIKKYRRVTLKEKTSAFVHIHHLRDLKVVDGLINLVKARESVTMSKDKDR